MPAPPDQPPESIVIGAFSGIKNTVAPERLQQGELERAVNVDIDDAGQLRRRRGYTKVHTGRHHSLRTVDGRTFVVRDDWLGTLDPSYGFTSLLYAGLPQVAYTTVNEEVYVSSPVLAHVIGRDNAVRPWGKTAGQGLWLSPVLSPTDTLGAVGGRLLGDPVHARCLEAYKGRIYLAAGKTLWATDLYLYDVVDRTKNFIQFEYEITLVMAVGDGLYVGTTGGLYFLQGVLGEFQLQQISASSVAFGSGRLMPAEIVNPNARNQPLPSSEACVFLTSTGVVAGCDNGTCYNLTQGTVEFPQAASAAALFRQDQGANAYVVAVDSGGSPSANARIGDYVDAEIVRRR